MLRNVVLKDLCDVTGERAGRWQNTLIRGPHDECGAPLVVAKHKVLWENLISWEEGSPLTWHPPR